MRLEEAIPLPHADSTEESRKATAVAVVGTDAVDDAVYAQPTYCTRPVNYRLMIVVLICAAIGGGAMAGLHHHQMSKLASQYYDLAQHHRRQGELERAANALRLYYRLVPTDAQARIDLALTLGQMAETPRQHFQALMLYEEILRDHELNAEIRRGAADAALRFGRYHDAIFHLKFALKADPEDGSLYARLGTCHEALGNLDEAQNSYEAAIVATPHLADSYKQLVALLRSREKTAEANKVLNRFAEANPDAFEPYLLRARFSRESGNVADALIDAQRAYSIASSNPDVLVLVSEFVGDKTTAAAARTYFETHEVRGRLQRELQEQPDSAPLVLALARFELLEGQLGAAEKRLRTALEQQPDEKELRWHLADVLLQQRKLTEARQEIATLRTQDVYPPLLTYLEARQSILDGNWLLAAQQLESIRSASLQERDLQSQVFVMSGLCYRQLGQKEREIDSYRRAVSMSPALIDARLGLAEALADANRVDDALLHFRQLMHIPRVVVRVARLEAGRNYLRTPDERDWSQVENLLNSATRDEGTLVDVLLLRAEMLLAQGHAGRAQEMLERGTRQHPGRVRIWVALADLVQQQHGVEKAMQVLQSAEDSFGQRVELLLAEAQLWARRGGDPAAANIAQLARRHEAFSRGSQALLLEGLAFAAEQVGDGQLARELWQQLLERRPDDLRAAFRLLNSALATGALDDVERLLGEIRRIEGPDGLHWRLGEAGRCLLLAQDGDRKQFARARRLLVAARDSMPKSTRPLTALARLELLEGNTEAAIEHLSQAVHLGETTPQVVSQLVELLYSRWRFQEADEIIAKVWNLPNVPFTGDLGRLAARVSLRAENHERALKLARKAVASDDKSYQDHLWLGRILWASGQPDAVEQQYRAAIEMAPQRPEPWVALVQFLKQTDRQAELPDLFMEIRQHVPQDQVDLTLAQCYELAGDVKQAERFYQQALERNPDDAVALWNVARSYGRQGGLEQTEKLVRQVLRLEENVSQALQRQARRFLSVLLASRGGQARIEEALELIQQNLKENPRSIDDLRSKAKLLALRPIRRLQMEAISILVQMEELSSLRPADEILLVQLYIAVDDWPSARALIHGLLANQSGDAEYLSFGIRTMLDHHENRESVGDWLDMLERLEPNRFRTTTLRARYLVAQEKLGDGLQLLKEFLSNPDSPPTNEQLRSTADLFARIAREFERSGRLADAELFAGDAEKLYRKYVKDNPDQILLLARFLATSWRSEESLALCEQAWAKAPPNEVAATCNYVLKHGQPTPEQFQTVRSWLRSALAEHNRPADLLFQAAVLAQLEEDYARAEALYLETITKSPEAVLAYNELALLLALGRGTGTEALAMINRAIELSGPRSFLLDSRATVYLVLGQPAAAIRDLREAIADSETAASYFHLAQAQLENDDELAARTSYQKGLAAGLRAESLHPLENQQFKELQSKLQ